MIPLLWMSTASAVTVDVYPADDLFAVLDTVQAGDEVIVHAGTYSTQQTSGSWFRELQLDGTAADPIVIRAADSELVVLEGDPAGSQNVLNIGGAYWTLKGFEIVYGSHGVRVQASSFATLEDLHIHDTGDVGLSCNIGGSLYEAITIRGTHIHDTGGTGECMYLGCNDDGCQMFDSLIEGNHCHDTLATSQGDGIEVKTGSYNNVVRDNVIHDVNYPGITMYGARGRGDNIVEGNIIWNAGDNGIQVVAETVVRNNLVFASGNNGIQAKSSQGQDPADLEIVHNTVVEAGSSCFKGNDFDGATNLVIANNVFACDAGSAINALGTPASATWSANAVVGSSNSPSGDLAAALGDLTDPANLDAYPVPGASFSGLADPAFALADDVACQPRATPSEPGAWQCGGSAPWVPMAGFKPECATGTPPTGDTGDTGLPNTDPTNPTTPTDPTDPTDPTLPTGPTATDPVPTDDPSSGDEGKGGCGCASAVDAPWFALAVLLGLARRGG